MRKVTELILEVEEKEKFELYRKRIKDAYEYDINEFKQKIDGGLADKKKITDFDIHQILKGIEVEKEHTKDICKAIEIVMDHLEEMSDYYDHLDQMEAMAKKD